MAALKTTKTRKSVEKFLSSLENEQQKNDCQILLKLMNDITKEKAFLWGENIVGFGSYHYVYATGNEGDWPCVAFSPRKQYISVYIMPGFTRYDPIMKTLGKFKTGKSCLNIKKLEDIHLPSLKNLIKKGYADIKKMYP